MEVAVEVGGGSVVVVDVDVDVDVDVGVKVEVVVGSSVLVVVVVMSVVDADSLELIGRSGWSVGTGVGSGVDEATEILVVLAVPSSRSCSASSFSLGNGRSPWLIGSLHSANRWSFQSTKVPLCSLTLVSLTITVHSPSPDSPQCATDMNVQSEYPALASSNRRGVLK